MTAERPRKRCAACSKYEQIDGARRGDPGHPLAPRSVMTPAKGLLVLGVAGLALGQTCEQQARDVAIESSDARECAVDDDCTLMPSRMTCCGECKPVPPFEPVPRTAVDSRLLELETACATTIRLCEPPVCEDVPPGCTAYAICLDGRCRVIATGCDAHLADLATDPRGANGMCD